MRRCRRPLTAAVSTCSAAPQDHAAGRERLEGRRQGRLSLMRGSYKLTELVRWIAGRLDTSECGRPPPVIRCSTTTPLAHSMPRAGVVHHIILDEPAGPARY